MLAPLARSLFGMRWLTLVSLLALFLACAAAQDVFAKPSWHKPGKPDPQANLTGGGASLKQLRYDITLYSFDGTPIEMTVFQPALEENEPAPLVLYSHGWGGSRSTDLAGDDFLTETARDLWESGYFIITFDQRGFGDSGGEANVQSPDIEGRDIQAIINWAEGTLTPHLAYSQGDPRVGGLGLSYGGGFQLVGAGVDPRFDALVPVITWNDLPYSLAPDRVPKTLWLSFLTGGGAVGGKLAPWLYESYLESLTGEVSETTIANLAPNGLADFCTGTRADGRGTPQADAFFIQGVNDTLFNTNEAVWNYDCMRKAGNDAYLMVTHGGHTFPGIQHGMPGTINREAQCGARRYDLGDLAYGFLDGKLRGMRPTIDMPRVCLVQDEHHGIVSDSVPVGGRDFEIDTGNVLTGPPSIELILNLLRKLDVPTLAEVLSNLSADSADLVLAALLGLENPETLTPLVTDLLLALPPELIAELGTAPRFIPLYRAYEAQALAGIPLADFQLEGQPDLDPRIFVGIGVKRRGQLGAKLLNDQVLPMRGTGAKRTELVGISEQLRFGDEVGLLIYSFHPQYALSFSKAISPVEISGTVSLPLH